MYSGAGSAGGFCCCSSSRPSFRSPRWRCSRCRRCASCCWSRRAPGCEYREDLRHGCLRSPADGARCRDRSWRCKAVAYPIAPDHRERLRVLARVDRNGGMKIFKGTPHRKRVGSWKSTGRRCADIPRSFAAPEGGRLLLCTRTPVRRIAGEVLAGELDPAYVWGAEEDLKAGTILCVVEDSQLRLPALPEGCSHESAGDPVQDRRPGRESRDVVWQQARRCPIAVACGRSS